MRIRSTILLARFSAHTTLISVTFTHFLTCTYTHFSQVPFAHCIAHNIKRGVCFSNVIIPCVRNFLFIFLLWSEKGCSMQSLQKFVSTFINSEQNLVSDVWQGSLSHYFKFLFKKQQESQKTHNRISVSYLHRSSPSSPSYMQNRSLPPQPCALMGLSF